MSSNLVRAFFALPLEQTALKALAYAREQLRRRAERGRVTARFLPDESLHVTLCFLGYVERDALPEFLAVLQKAAPFELIASDVKALGAFPNPHRARLVVAELSDPARRMAELHELVTKACEPLGIPSETRPFRAHVTLARLKRPTNVRDWLDHADAPTTPIVFRELRLYESQLLPSGSVYSLLGGIELGARE